ncbi:hypothetical protein Pint_22618 [Pistacia integerrima]|uniref:Uncharacterized protein n=1 Tax=Pistacia integerrima TaxID=434235 RepID=A0ACC0YMC5_9ROSI|nr:hypothetical protein Pint_22618 [Pistacia integerrima]
MMIHSNSNPPLLNHLGQLLSLSHHPLETTICNGDGGVVINQECQLPLIDLSGLNSPDEKDKLACAAAISRASSEWGFFQVINHGISPELLKKMRKEQKLLFETSFENKATCGLLNNSYRWGNPTATTPKQFSWSEAFHIPLTRISDESCYGDFTSLSDDRICSGNVKVGEAWSNDVYKSVEHKVMANGKMERYSIAYFLCPSYETLIGSCRQPSVYRNFTFGEFRKQVQEDVKKIGHKVGLPRFLQTE